MERLTRRALDGGVHHPYLPCQMIGDSLEKERIANAKLYREMVEKLAKYEDTGLTPERCAELAKAEREGRLMEMPCKVGDAVYALVGMDDKGIYQRVKHDIIDGIYQDESGEFMISFTYIWHDTELSDIGKTVFLTHEEAEKALESEA